MSTRARATSMRAIRHGARKLTARARAVRALLSTGTKGRIPALWSDAGWFRDRNRTQPWDPNTDLEQQVQWVDDLTGQPRGWALGPNLVTNGDFSGGTTSWTPSGATIAVVSGELEITRNGSGQFISQQISTQAGRSYRVAIQHRNGTTSGSFYAGTTSGGTQLLAAQPLNTAGRGWSTFVFTATGATSFIQFSLSAIGTFYLSRVSAQEVILDQSWLGPELVTNGGNPFVNTASWASSSNFASTASVSSGLFRVTALVASGRQVSAVSLVVGRPYLLVSTGRFVSGTGAAIATISGDTVGGGVILVSTNATTEFVTITTPFVATASTMYVAAGTSGGQGVTEFSQISVREIPGHPSVSPSAGNGPTATARVNLLQRTEDFSHSVWTNATPNVPTVAANTNETTDPNGGNTADKATAATGGTSSQLRQIATVSVTDVYVASIYVKAGNATTSRFVLFNQAFTTVAAATLNWSGSTLTSLSSTTGTTSFVAVGNGWYRVVIRSASITATSLLISFFPDNAAGTGFVYLWGADLRLAVYDSLNLPAYQRVNDGSAGVCDYDHVGFPVRLVRGAANRGLMTLGTLDLTGTDAVNAGMWVLKTSDAAQAVLMETSATSESGSGMVALIGPSGTGANNYRARSAGATVSSATTAATFAAPTISALHLTAKISTDSLSLTVNGGTPATSSSSDQGTGNYGNLRLFEGGRSLDSSPSLSFTGEWLPGFVVDANGVPADLAAEVLREYAAAVNFYY